MRALGFEPRKEELREMMTLLHANDINGHSVGINTSNNNTREGNNEPIGVITYAQFV